MKRKATAVLVLVLLAFIWIHSLIPEGRSAAESTWFSNVIAAPVLHLFGIEELDKELLRKIAHMIEFFVFAFALCVFWRGKLKDSFFACFAAAFMDESIQALTGRSAEIRDVWIDLIGITVGIFLGRFLCARIAARRRAAEIAGKEAEPCGGGGKK